MENIVLVSETIEESHAIPENSLSLTMVDWKSYYVLSKASIGQIMVCFSKILNVMPKNVYEIKLYEKLKPATEKLLNEFNKLLIYNDAKDKDIRYYNLIVNLPKNISINDAENGLVILKSAKIGLLIKAIKQRISFIIEREIPERYLTDQELLQGFNNLRSNMVNYVKIGDMMDEIDVRNPKWGVDVVWCTLNFVNNNNNVVL